MVAKTGLAVRLKHETADIHRQIEQRPYSRALVERRLPVQAYVGHMACQLRYVRALEQRAGDLPQLWRGTMFRSPRLAADLAALEADCGLSGAAYAVAADPFVAAITDADRSTLAGMVYVNEGSMLGARILRRHLAAGLGIDDSRMTYVLGDGDALGPRWVAFRERLDQLDDDVGIDAARVVDGARRAFDFVGALADRVLTTVEGAAR